MPGEASAPRKGFGKSTGLRGPALFGPELSPRSLADLAPYARPRPTRCLIPATASAARRAAGRAGERARRSRTSRPIEAHSPLAVRPRRPPTATPRCPIGVAAHDAATTRASRPPPRAPTARATRGVARSSVTAPARASPTVPPRGSSASAALPANARVEPAARPPTLPAIRPGRRFASPSMASPITAAQTRWLALAVTAVSRLSGSPTHCARSPATPTPTAAPAAAPSFRVAPAAALREDASSPPRFVSRQRRLLVLCRRPSAAPLLDSRPLSFALNT
jgi:hypothetical protein